MVILSGLLNFIMIIACIEDPIFLCVSAVCLSFHAEVRKPACIGFSPNRTLWKVLTIEDSGLNQNPKYYSSISSRTFCKCCSNTINSASLNFEFLSGSWYALEKCGSGIQVRELQPETHNASLLLLRMGLKNLSLTRNILSIPSLHSHILSYLIPRRSLCSWCITWILQIMEETHGG